MDKNDSENYSIESNPVTTAVVGKSYGVTTNETTIPMKPVDLMEPAVLSGIPPSTQYNWFSRRDSSSSQLRLV